MAPKVVQDLPGMLSKNSAATSILSSFEVYTSETPDIIKSCYAIH